MKSWYVIRLIRKIIFFLFLNDRDSSYQVLIPYTTTDPAILFSIPGSGDNGK